MRNQELLNQVSRIRLPERFGSDPSTSRYWPRCFSNQQNQQNQHINSADPVTASETRTSTTETCLNLQRLEWEVVEGFQASWDNGLEGIRGAPAAAVVPFISGLPRPEHLC